MSRRKKNNGSQSPATTTDKPTLDANKSKSFHDIILNCCLIEREHNEKAAGLATQMFALAKACSSAAEFLLYVEDAERWVRTEAAGNEVWDDIKFPRSWSQAKSDIHGAFKAGVDFSTVETYSKMKQAKRDANAANGSAPKEAEVVQTNDTSASREGGGGRTGSSAGDEGKNHDPDNPAPDDFEGRTRRLVAGLSTLDEQTREILLLTWEDALQIQLLEMQTGKPKTQTPEEEPKTGPKGVVQTTPTKAAGPVTQPKSAAPVHMTRKQRQQQRRTAAAAAGRM